MSLPEHRAGDADRDRVASVLREAHAEGRLDAEELTARLDATYRARTFGELAAVTADLPPRETPPEVQRQPQPAARTPPALRAAWAAWVAAVLVNVVIWVLVSVSSGDVAYFWPMWVAGPWGAVLLVATMAGGHGRR